MGYAVNGKHNARSPSPPGANLYPSPPSGRTKACRELSWRASRGIVPLPATQSLIALHTTLLRGVDEGGRGGWVGGGIRPGKLLLVARLYFASHLRERFIKNTVELPGPQPINSSHVWLGQPPGKPPSPATQYTAVAGFWSTNSSGSCPAGRRQDSDQIAMWPEVPRPPPPPLSAHCRNPLPHACA